MEHLESIIKSALKEDLKGKRLEKSPACPSESVLADYAAGLLNKDRKAEIDAHLADCIACTEDLVLAEDAARAYFKNGRQAKNFKGWFKKHIWIVAALVTFVLSFSLPRYFLQFLAATLILAAKWIFDTVNAKILIMIYDAWKKGGEKEVSRVLKRFHS